MYKYLSGHVYMIRYINVADESAALLLSLMPNCNKNKLAWHNWYNRNDAMLILYKMLHTCGIMHTQRGCKFEKKAPMPRDVSSQMWPSLQWQKLVLEGNFVKSYHTFTEFNLFFVHLILNWRAYTFLLHIHVKYEYRIPFMIWKLQTTFSNVSSTKVFEFRLQFHWSLFPRVQLIVSQHWFR